MEGIFEAGDREISPFIEYLQQIKTFSLSVPVKDTLIVEVKTNSVKVGDLELRLDSLVLEPNSARIHSEEGWLTIQCQGAYRPSDSLNVAIDIPNHFNCLKCDSVVVETMTITKSLEMPSDYWYEMTDCWACHHEDYTTLHGQEGGLISAQPKVLMSGISYYLFHPSNVDLSNLVLHFTGREVSQIDSELLEDGVDEQDFIDTTFQHYYGMFKNLLYLSLSKFRSNRWVEVNCKRCYGSIGEGFMDRNCPESSTDIADVTTFKFHKYRILSSIVKDGINSSVPLKAFSHYFLKELIETANAHANYRFILVDEATFEPAILVWVLNWKCLSGSVIDGSIVLQPAVKILYINCHDSKSKDSESIMEKWACDRLVENFPQSRDSLVQFLGALNKSNSSLPTAKRSLKLFRVAIIDI